jgi:hypothetical protein
MIELNCTYEESKKILELGYDFSSICGKFEYINKLKDGHAVMYKVENNLSDGIKIYKPTYKLVMLEGFTPIIPKAALEACLPLDLELKTGLMSFFFRKNFFNKNIDATFYSGLRHRTFDSAFEAFIWCHENYPEELKKKFDEVMA